MNGRSRTAEPARIAGPAALFVCAALLVLAPLPRGSDYFIALIPLELLGLAILVAVVLRAARLAPSKLQDRPFDPLVATVLASPLLIALVQLVPVPASAWAHLPGRALYAHAVEALGIATAQWRPVTISPDATIASLLAGIPLVAAFTLGYLGTVRQLRFLVGTVTVVGLAEVVLGLMQLSGGGASPLYFGMQTYGSPIGSLGTRNEYANFLALALGGHIWLCYDSLRYSMRYQPGAPLRSGRFDDRHALAAWVAAGLVFVIGILISHSRAGALFGLGCALAAVGLAGLRVFGQRRAWRFLLPLAAVLAIAAVTMVGPEAIMARITGSQLEAAAGFRHDLWRSSLHAAWQYFPLGSGWGTYDIAYRPYQLPQIAGYPNHAHMDYLEMFVEGGLLFVVFGGIAAWVTARRASRLCALALRERTLDRESMMSALCGTALLGFLLHAAVDFPMRVPANAIVAALFAGVFLRPLPPLRHANASAQTTA